MSKLAAYSAQVADVLSSLERDLDNRLIRKPEGECERHLLEAVTALTTAKKALKSAFKAEHGQ